MTSLYLDVIFVDFAIYCDGIWLPDIETGDILMLASTLKYTQGNI